MDDSELDPTIVPIPDTYEISMDDWLASLRRDEPTALVVSGAELVAEARAEAE
jgi:hypothetical protein